MRYSLAFASFVFVSAAATTTAFAQQPPAKQEPSPQIVKEAGTHFQRGTDEYNEGNYRLALVEMQRAYDLVPNYRVLYNLGQIHAQLGNFTKSQELLEQYLSEGGAEVPVARQEQVRKDLAALALKIGTLRMKVTEADAEVLVDDHTLGKSPLPSAVRIDAGDHRIRVEKEGYKSEIRTITLVGGEELLVEVKLDRLKFGGEQPIVPQQHSAIPMWVGWGVTAALGIGGGVTGALAIGSSHDLRDIRDQPNASASARDDAYDKTRTLGTVSTVLVIGAGVGAVVSTYLTIVHIGARKREAAATTGSIAPTLNGFYGTF